MDVSCLEGATYFRLRLTVGEKSPDVSNFVQKELFPKYVNESYPYLLVSEIGKDGNNPHFHFAFASDKKIEAIRQFVKRAGFTGNESYELKSADLTKMPDHFQYLMKGTSANPMCGPTVTFAHEYFTKVLIKDLHETFWKLAALSSGKKRKRDNSPISHQILKICVATHKPVTEDQLIDITLKWYAENRTSMNAFHMKGVITWVSYMLNDESNRMALFRNTLKFQ